MELEMRKARIDPGTRYRLVNRGARSTKVVTLARVILRVTRVSPSPLKRLVRLR